MLLEMLYVAQHRKILWIGIICFLVYKETLLFVFSDKSTNVVSSVHAGYLINRCS